MDVTDDGLTTLTAFMISGERESVGNFLIRLIR